MMPSAYPCHLCFPYLAWQGWPVHLLKALVIIEDSPLPPSEPVSDDNSSAPPEFPVPAVTYDEFLLAGHTRLSLASCLPASELDPIALNYTSGTTSAPKGVVFTHRGAYLNAVAVILMSSLPGRSVYLWTLPMFHCNGWCFPWAMAALSGSNVCMRHLDVDLVFSSIVEHRVGMMCGAPTVLTMLINAPPASQAVLKQKSHVVKICTGGAPPPPAVIGKMEELGFHVLHIYGLTETYGPGTICEWREEDWGGMGLEERARVNARQGVRHLGLEAVTVRNPETMEEVPWDATTMGEVMFRGNTVMLEYARDPDATAKCFSGGWFHSGDLAVVYPDGYIQLKDRSKDIIISGGENISTIQVEGALFQHPDVFEAAVAAMPDEKWGELPCAFVTLKPGAALGNSSPALGSASGVPSSRQQQGSSGPGEGAGGFSDNEGAEREIIKFCRAHLPKFMAPRRVVFGPLPKTSTGKVQKFKLRAVAKTLAQSAAQGKQEAGPRSRL